MGQKLFYIVIQIFILGAVFLAGVKTRSIMAPSWQKKFANAKKIKPYKLGHVVDKTFEKKLGKIEKDVFVTRCITVKGTIDPYLTHYKIDTDGEAINLITSFADKDMVSFTYETKDSHRININYRGIYPSLLFRHDPQAGNIFFFDRNKDGIFDIMIKNEDKKKDKRKNEERFIRLNSKWRKAESKDGKSFVDSVGYKFNKEKGCWAVCDNNEEK